MNIKKIIKTISREDLSLITSERNRNALSDYMDGKKFKEIGGRFKITQSYARTLVERALLSIKKERLYRSLESNPDASHALLALSVDFVFSGDVSGCLIRAGYKRIGDLVVIAPNIKRIQGIGHKGAVQIEAFFERFSFLPWKRGPVICRADLSAFKWAISDDPRPLE